MKFLKLILIIVPLLKYNSALSQIYECTISGKILGACDNTLVYLIKYEKIDNKITLDTISSTTIKNESFAIKCSNNEEGEVAFIKIDTTLQKISGRKNDLVIFMDNSKIRILGTMKTWPEVDIQGSPSTLAYQEIVNRILAYKNKLNSDPKLLQTTPLFVQMDSVKNILKDYPNALSTPAIALKYPYKGENIIYLYNSWSNRVKNSHYGKIVKEALETIEKQTKIQEGEVIPNFSVSFENGDTTNIHELIEKGNQKYTLLDFWASWCSPCRKEIPKLRTALDKFADNGFSIISISIDNKKSDWIKAVHEEKMPWIQAIELKKSASQMFNLTTIPAYILVDNQNKMIAFYCTNSALPSFGPIIKADSLNAVINRLTTANVSKKVPSQNN